MRRRNLIIAGLVALILALCVFLWLARSASPPLKVTVSFAGYTNDASGTRLALFQVVNRSDVTIKRWGIYHLEVAGDARLHGPFFFGRSARLAPGQSAPFALPVHTNQAVWRAALHCSRVGWRQSFSDWTGGLPPSVSRLIPKKLQWVPVELARSDWIEK